MHGRTQVTGKSKRARERVCTHIRRERHERTITDSAPIRERARCIKETTTEIDGDSASPKMLKIPREIT